MCQVGLSGEFSISVNDCPGVGSISDPTDKIMDAWDISDLKIFVLLRIKVDVETVQSWILFCEYTPVKQCKREGCSSVETKVVVSFRELNRYNMLEASVV